LQALEHQLSLLPSAASSGGSCNRTVTSLRTTLSNEASARIAADLRLNERISESRHSYHDCGQLNAAADARSTNEIAAELTNLTNESRDSSTRHAESSDCYESTIVFGVEANDLQAQIDSILGLMVTFYLTLKRNRFPVVDGSVPPNLVYLDDGSLVYTEE
jgi:hypothetical protein